MTQRVLVRLMVLTARVLQVMQGAMGTPLAPMVWVLQVA